MHKTSIMQGRGAKATLIGSVIGVGIFGIPYVFAQAGFVIGITHLIVVAIVNGFVLVTYGDIVMNTTGKSRLTGLLKKYLGLPWSWVGTVFAFASSWGAMIAYIIIGGEFLHALLGPVLGGELLTYQMVFYAMAAFMLIGGLGFISRIENFFVMALFFMLFLIVVGSVPEFDVENLMYVHEHNWFLPFGVLLFAFGGMAAIPEMADILGKEKHKLRSSIISSIVIIGIVYTIFASAVIAVTGVNTSEEAVIGLGSIVGNWVLIVGSVIGLFAVFTSFLILGIANIDTLVFDFKQRYLASWALVVAVPFIVFMLGARDFIDVIGYTGGILGGLTGLLVLYMYVKAKKHACTPKRCLQIPGWIIALVALVLGFGVVATAIGL